MSPSGTEGVIRFESRHETRQLEPRVLGETASVLAAWREVMARLGLIGQDASRYEGYGYGNVSARVGPFGDVGRGRRRFLITGTQTAGRARVSLDDFGLVERYDIAGNQVTSTGSCRRRPRR